MIELTGKDVDKYDKISKEIASIAKEFESKKEEVQTLISALSIMQTELDENIKHLQELGATTEKEVLRLESLTINDDSMLDAEPVQEEPPVEEPAEVVPEDTSEKNGEPADNAVSAPSMEQGKKSKKSKVNEAQQTLLSEEPISENAN